MEKVVHTRADERKIMFMIKFGSILDQWLQTQASFEMNSD